MGKGRKDSIGKEEETMTLLTKPLNSMIKIDKDKSEQFLADRKRNAISPEFLEQCQRYNKIMNRNKKRG